MGTSFFHDLETMRSALFRSIQASATENEVLSANLVPRVALHNNDRGFHI